MGTVSKATILSWLEFASDDVISQVSNLLESFFHKAEGKIVKTITEANDKVTITFSDDSTKSFYNSEFVDTLIATLNANPVDGWVFIKTKAQMEALTGDSSKGYYVLKDDVDEGNNGSWGFDGSVFYEGYSLPTIEPEGIKLGSKKIATSGDVAKRFLNKSNLEIVSNNLFNKVTTSPGVYTDSSFNGDLLASGSRFTSDFIAVTPTKTYYFPSISFASFWLDKNTFVAGAPRNTPTTFLTIPAGVNFIKVSPLNTEIDIFQFNENSLKSYDNFKQEVKTTELTRVYNKIQSEKIAIRENDWYDPNFINPYSQLTVANGALNTTQDFAFLKERYNTKQKSVVLDGENVLEFTATDTSLREEKPSFSKQFFDKLGYENTDKIKIGFWIKFPGATISTTRRFYFSGESALPLALIIDTNEWQWFESDGLRTVNSDDWQTFVLGGRDLATDEKYYIKGFTLTNVTKDVWTGERKATKFEKGLQEPYVNLYPFSKNIYPDNQILNDTYLQSGIGLVSEISTITEPFAGNAFKFTTDANSINRLNFPVIIAGNDTKWGDNKAVLPQIKKDVWLQVSFYVRMTSTLPKFLVGFLNERHTDNGMYNDFNDLTPNTWHLVKSIPILLDADDVKDFKDYKVQLHSLVAPSDGSQVVFEVAGLNYSLNQNKFAFRQDYVNNRASLNRFYSLKMTTYTDSVGAANQWQVYANAYLGTNHINRCIGGSTVGNNSGTAWVTMVGELIAKDATEVNRPSGTENVDYKLIESSMCRQERIDTIPTDTKLLVMAGGYNDTNNRPIGNISDAPSDATNASYIASVKSMFIKAEGRVPNAFKVRVTMNPRELEADAVIYDDGNGTTHYLYEYREVDKILADMYGYPIIDVNNLGVNSTNWSSYSDDEIHPNPALDILMADKFVQGINKNQQFDIIRGF